MKLLFLFVIALVCFMLIYEDYKTRHVSWKWLLLLLIGIMAFSLFLIKPQQLLYYTGINIVFLLTQFILLSFYYSAKNKKCTNIIDKYVGLGDWIILAVLTFAFHPVNYILFYFLFSFASIFVYGI